MFYIATITFPLKSAVELGKVFVEAVSKQLNYVNRVGMWMCYGGEGVQSWFVYEIVKGHEEEGYKELTGYYAIYFNIEGFKVDLYPVLKPEDALSLIGINPPA